ncbi:MAG: polysaccharide biosynthesis/export family protein [Planctomycetota bacterium]
MGIISGRKNTRDHILILSYLFIYIIVILTFGCRGVINPEYPEELVRNEPLDAEGLRNKYPQLRGIVISAKEWWDEYYRGKEELEYRISPNMSIQIEVFEEPMLSRTILIRPDGKVDLPLIGEVQAADKTIYEFKSEIIRKLKRFIKDPHVIVNTVSTGLSLGPSQITGGKIAVLGAGGIGWGAGEINYTGQEKLSTVLSSALSPVAEWRSIRVIRPNPKDPKKARIIICDFFKLMKFGDVSQDIPLRPGDIIVIPRRWLPGRQFERDWDTLLKFASGTISWNQIFDFWEKRLGH